VIGWDFDQNDLNTVGVLDPHLGQSPRLGYRCTKNAGTGRGQPLMLSVNISHLKPEHHRLPGSAGRVAGDFQNPEPTKKTTPGSPGAPNSR
jgi:hypothetical protein